MAGFVYVMSNPSMPGKLKIGRSDRDPEEYRRAELSNTAVPTPFQVEYYVFVDNYKSLEREIHFVLKQYRVSKDREFFACDVVFAIEAIRSSTEGKRRLEQNNHAESQEHLNRIEEQKSREVAQRERERLEQERKAAEARKQQELEQRQQDAERARLERIREEARQRKEAEERKAREAEQRREEAARQLKEAEERKAREAEQRREEAARQLKEAEKRKAQQVLAEAARLKAEQEAAERRKRELEAALREENRTQQELVWAEEQRLRDHDLARWISVGEHIESALRSVKGDDYRVRKETSRKSRLDSRTGSELPNSPRALSSDVPMTGSIFENQMTEFGAAPAAIGPITPTHIPGITRMSQSRSESHSRSWSTRTREKPALPTNKEKPAKSALTPDIYPDSANKPFPPAIKPARRVIQKSVKVATRGTDAAESHRLRNQLVRWEYIKSLGILRHKETGAVFSQGQFTRDDYGQIKGYVTRSASLPFAADFETEILE